MQIKIGITGHRDLYDPVTKTDCSKTIKKEIDDRLDFLIEKENVSACIV